MTYNLAEALVSGENTSFQGTGWVGVEVRMPHNVGEDMHRGIGSSLHCNMTIKHSIVRLRGVVL